MPKNNMTYHILEETERGYVLRQSVANFSTLKKTCKPDKPRWIVFSRRITLDNLSSIGMPNGFYWDGYQFVDQTMPVKAIIR